MICGSVKIDDSSSSNNASVKQYISMINEDMNNLSKQTKLNVDVIGLDSKQTITDNLKVVHDRLNKFKKIAQQKIMRK